ncbi:MAG: hypothetical protein V4819_00960 [Verrucomicrobiota bacterium]
MTWVEFVKRWPLADLMDLGIPRRTVYAWRDGSKEPTGWQREAAEFWIEGKVGGKIKPKKGAAEADGE